MTYKTLLALLERYKGKGGDPNMVTIPKEMFRHLLVGALKTKNLFDERDYLAAYPDIRDAVKKKKIESAADHYFHSGYFEGRVPKKIFVDEKYYLENNPDVAEGIKKKRVKSCQQHFDSNGFFEGRSPYRGFSLF
jgi:hypothetical protein